MTKHIMIMTSTLFALTATAAAQPAAPPPPPTSSTAIVELVEGENTPAERRARFEIMLPSEGGSEVRTITGATEFQVKLNRSSVRARNNADTVDLEVNRSERRGKDLISSQARMSWVLRPGQRTVVARIAPPGAARLDVAVTVN
jgi:hypothetical protein